MRSTSAAARHIWLISPYHTGSHKAWAEGYARHSHHRITLLTLDGRFWKWRMQGGGLALASMAEGALSEGQPDAILCTDMLNVPSWLAFLRGKLADEVPILLYMHENQLTYPWRPGEKVDLTYALINVLSQCCVQEVAFNSNHHMGAWFAALPNLLKHFPDYNQLQRIDKVRQRSRVLPVGIDLPNARTTPASANNTPPVILWNQRWEYDKRPDRFFALLYRLQESGIPFKLAVAGENFRNVPEEFEVAREQLAAHIVHWGYLPDRVAYEALLATASLVISTADHEFFGISILEAVAAGAFPLLPNRLSYPELVPGNLASQILYADEEDLYEKARTHLTSSASAPYELRQHVIQTCAWSIVAAQYDAWIDHACES